MKSLSATGLSEWIYKKKKVFAQSKVGGDGGASSSALLLVENRERFP